HLRLGVVDLGAEHEVAGVAGIRHAIGEAPNALVLGEREELPRWTNPPARERASDFDNIFLRVAAVYAERVELHELARIVLVETTRPALLRRRAGGNRERGTGNRSAAGGPSRAQANAARPASYSV